MTKRSTWIGIAIVGFWLVTMGALLTREFLPRFLSATPSALAIQDYDRWFGLYVGDTSRVGAIHMASVSATQDGQPGTRTIVDARLSLNLLDMPTELVADAEVWMPYGREEVEFSGRLTSGDHTFEAIGSVRDGVLKADVSTGDQSFPVQWPLGELGSSTAMFAAGAALPPLKPGESIDVPTFDPMTMRTGNATVTCLDRETISIGGEDVRTTVCETTLSGMRSRIWLDASGEIVQAQTPYGFTLRRISEAEAGGPVDSADATDALAMAAIAPTGRTPFRGARRMVVRLRGIDGYSGIPEDANQQLHDDGVVSIASPARPGRAEGPLLDPALRDAALASDPLIQASHPVIVEEAKRIAGDADGVWARATCLYRWVYENIDKAPVPSVPSALDVLKTREGDCNEHTVLFTALARSLGIPTRVAVGVVWSDDRQAFYYHAWPEVYAGSWIPMDPTLGQPIADATHLKLVEGDIARWPRLIAYLGRMKIEVLDIE